jgi:DNA-binding response OmpR family regulator
MAKILVIDDDRMVRDTLKIILVAAGHEVRLAEDGNKGMLAFGEFAPDLVITDILMPEKEGMETIRELRELRPDVPIIAISGGGRVGNMSFLRVAERFGANRSITKPFEPEQIVATVAELLPQAA